MIRFLLIVILSYIICLILTLLMSRVALWVVECLIESSADEVATDEEFESIVDEYMDDEEYWDELETLVTGGENETRAEDEL